MRTIISISLVLIVSVASAAVQNGTVVAKPLQGSLSATIGSIDNGWVMWEAPLSRPDVFICCWDSKNSRRAGSCSLNGAQGFNITDSDDRLAPGRTLQMFVRLKDGNVVSMSSYTSDCNIAAGGERITRIDAVPPAQSVSYLRSLVRARGTKVQEHSIAAIALHAAPEAIPTIEEFTRPGNSRDLREHAVFWLANAGGARGFEIVKRIVWDDSDQEVQQKAVFALSISDQASVPELERIARTHPKERIREEAVFWFGQKGGEPVLPALLQMVRDDPSAEIREKAVFAISQIEGDRATRALVDLAKNHRSRQTREKAIFWLSQRAGEEITRTIRDTIDNDPDRELREMAVFAISQRQPDEAIPALIDLARTHRDPAVRAKAVFWLGQTGDPRAVDAIEKILLDR